MADEVERRFLVHGDGPDGPSVVIRQGYAAIGRDGLEVRLREKAGKHTLGVKYGVGLVRTELEYPLSEVDFRALWPATEGFRLEKTRTTLVESGHTIEYDVYTGALAGLRVVEVEFDSADAAAAFVPPAWFGPEVTDTPGYRNQDLAAHGLPES